MSVIDGQAANQGTFNGGFMSRLDDDTTVGRKDFLNTNPASGPSVINIQREVNSNNSFSGRPSGSAHDATPVWTNNNLGTSSDNLHERAEAQDASMHQTTGHKHDNTPGSGGPISANDLADVNIYHCLAQSQTFSGAAGTSDDVSSIFGASTPGGGSATVGILTTAPDNKVYIVDEDTQTFLEDAEGDRVYGRLTESAGVWTLSYYTNEAGVETSYSIPSPVDIAIIYREVFTQDQRPTIPAWPLDFGTLDLTADVVDASDVIRGVVSTGTQSFGGSKTFKSDVAIEGALSGTQEVDSSLSGSDQLLATPTKIFKAVSNAGLVSIGAITAPSKTQVFILANKTGVVISILNESGSQTAANRILTGASENLELPINSQALLVYDTVSSRWRVAGVSASSVKADLPNLQVFDGDPAPTTAFTAAFPEWQFVKADEQMIVLVAIAPKGFQSGKKIYAEFSYSGDASGNFFLRAVAKRFVVGDLRTSPTGSETTTHTLTVAGGDLDEIARASLLVTQSDGDIGSAPLAENEILVVELTRRSLQLSDTNTGTMSVVKNVRLRYETI